MADYDMSEIIRLHTSLYAEATNISSKAFSELKNKKADAQAF